MTLTRGDFAANISMLFKELPLPQRPRAARAAGFETVECWWPFTGPKPSAAEIDAFVRALEVADVGLWALNCYAGDMPAGERGVLSLPDRTEEFRASADVLTHIARQTGCRLFNALYGQRADGLPTEVQDRCAAENLAFIAEAVGEFGGTVLLEPLTRGENGPYPLLTATDVLTVVSRVPADNLRLLLDVYHLTNNDDDVLAIAGTQTDVIGHIQVADTPGRHQPGTGTIDFTSIFHALREGGYAGKIGCEYLPLGPSTESFGWIEEVSR